MPKLPKRLSPILLAAWAAGCGLNPFPELPFGDSDTSDTAGPPPPMHGAGGSSGGMAATGGTVSTGGGGGTDPAGGSSGAAAATGGTGGTGSGGISAGGTNASGGSAGAPGTGGSAMAGASSGGGAGAPIGGFAGFAGSGFAGSGFAGSGFAGASMGGAAGMCEGCGTSGQGGASGEGPGGAGGAGGMDPALVHGTCDLRAVNASCLEVTDSASVVAMAQMTCLLNGGTWSDMSCPAAALVGCCAYSATSTYRDCSYSGASGDPAADCAMIQGAVWTPAVASE